MSSPYHGRLDGPTVRLLAMQQAEPCMLCKVYQWLMGGVTMVWIYLWSRYIYSLDISNTGCRLCLMPVASLRSAHCELLRLICSIDTFSGHSNWQWPVMVTVTSCDWSTAGHVTTVLSSHWSPITGHQSPAQSLITQCLDTIYSILSVYCLVTKWEDTSRTLFRMMHGTVGYKQ